MSDEAMGRFLHNMLGGDPQPGPPHVHTFGGPSLPVSFYSLLHVICGGCGKRFWGREQRAERRYREHYERVHNTPPVPYTITTGEE